MAATITSYDNAPKVLGGGVDLNTSTFKLALVTSAYAFNPAHTIWGDASATEVVTGDGYTTGGAALASVTFIQSAGVATLDAADVTFAALTKTFRGGILYATGTFDTLVNPVVAYILFDATDTVISAIDYVVKWHASGILAISRT